MSEAECRRVAKLIKEKERELYCVGKSLLHSVEACAELFASDVAAYNGLVEEMAELHKRYERARTSKLMLLEQQCMKEWVVHK